MLSEYILVADYRLVADYKNSSSLIIKNCNGYLRLKNHKKVYFVISGLIKKASNF